MNFLIMSVYLDVAEDEDVTDESEGRDKVVEMLRGGKMKLILSQFSIGDTG
jgi:hypothetical protein